MKEPVLVSVLCTAYNHGEYIRQCLDGFIAQETDFAYEVLINDDASTDNTAEIIREYEIKYPDIIKPIYQTENQYSQGIGNILVHLLPKAQGKYIALCEGDDYWCDPEKLKKQIHFLENHSEYSASIHNVMTVDINGKEIGIFGNKLPKEDCDITALNGYLDYAQTSSYVFLNPLKLNLPDADQIVQYISNWDKSFALYMIKTGKVRFFADTMSCYRFVTDTGTSYSANKKQNNITEKAIVMEMGFFNQINAYDLNIDMSKHFFRNVCAYSFKFFVKHPSFDNLKLHFKAIKAFPYSKWKYIKTMTSYFSDKYLSKKS